MDWTLEKIYEAKPRYVVQIGDLRDYYWLSSYAKTYKVMPPQEEFERGTAAARDMWMFINHATPVDAELYQIKGNHDDRAEKRLLESHPELEPLVNFEQPFSFEGVKTIHDSKEELWIGDIAVLHGYMAHGAHARHNQCPTIVGHSHRGGVSFFKNRKGVYWELNTGFGGDTSSLVFHYRNQKQIDGWTLGLGVVDENGPRFIPYRGKP